MIFTKDDISTSDDKVENMSREFNLNKELVLDH